MSDPLRSDGPGAGRADAGVDRDGQIEELLLQGLDQYFSGRYEQAIHVWTRVLFLDRGHARARAYIERARGALSERQRESEELLQSGVAAFHRGDAHAARDLLTSAVESGGAQEDALALLGRLDRLQAGAAASVPHAQPVVGQRRGRSGLAVPVGRRPRTVRLLPGVLILMGLLAGASLLLTSDRFAGWLRVAPAPRAAPPLPLLDEPLPVPRSGDVALGRGRRLFERGHLHEALRVLDSIRPGDPLTQDADLLRASIQRALLTAAGAAGTPEPGTAEPR